MPPGILNPPGRVDLALLTPELVLMGGGMLLLLVEMLLPRRTAFKGALAIAILCAALATVFTGPWNVVAPFHGQAMAFFTPTDHPITAFRGNLVIDGFALTMKAIVLLGSILATLLGLRYAERFRNPGEFFALLLFATAAGALLTGAADLLMIYLAVEFLSLTSYVLVGYLKFQPRSTEAALKYFLYGAITAAVMLYGMSLLYGLTGTTSLYAIPGDRVSFITQLGAAQARTGGSGVLMIALVMVLVGFGFKVAMAPFHQWVPDVYDGAPLPVMAWLSVASKAAGMAVLVRVFFVALPPQLWTVPIAALAALTMTAGNLAALPQGNIKRMLAYSSIAHAGYTLMALAALGATVNGNNFVTDTYWQSYAIPVYLVTYVFMNLGALAVVMAVYNKIKSHRIDDYAGLVRRSPGLAWLMLFFLLSLAGIPPTAGFFGKFVLFAAVLEARLYWLAILGFINSVVSVYYYWNVVRAMFLMKPVSDEDVRPAPELNLTLAIAALATLAIFVFAGQFMLFFAAQR
jgi:NADH-quinone oxidoreductase subunit N